MTALGNIQAGGRLTAAMLQGVAPYAVIKGADETVTSSATLQNDDALFLAVAANTSWLFDAYLDYEGGTLGASDLKYEWTVPSGAALRYGAAHLDTSGNNICSDTHPDGAAVSAGTNGGGDTRSVKMYGTLIVGGTAGTLQLKWAQNTSSGTGTIVHAQSYLTLWQIS